MIGEIRMFAGTFAPRDWAFCDGQLISVSSNSALFSILGTTYGGDGRTTFGLPDLRGRAPVHEGNGPGLDPVNLGQKGGSTSITLSNSNLPSHSHTGYIKLSDTPGNSYHADNGYIADSSRVAYKQYSVNAPAGNKTINGVQTNATGGGQAYYKRSPFTAVNFIICLYGTYPSRD